MALVATFIHCKSKKGHVNFCRIVLHILLLTSLTIYAGSAASARNYGKWLTHFLHAYAISIIAIIFRECSMFVWTKQKLQGCLQTDPEMSRIIVQSPCGYLSGHVSFCGDL